MKYITWIEYPGWGWEDHHFKTLKEAKAYGEAYGKEEGHKYRIDSAKDYK